MAAVTFDTLRIAQALRDAGFDDRQSEAIVSAINEALGESVATKFDLTTGLANLRADIYSVRADIYRALWLQGAGLVAAIAAAIGAAVAIARAIS